MIITMQDLSDLTGLNVLSITQSISVVDDYEPKIKVHFCIGEFTDTYFVEPRSLLDIEYPEERKATRVFPKVEFTLELHRQDVDYTRAQHIASLVRQEWDRLVGYSTWKNSSGTF